jgi:hypothetical protein
MEIDESLDTSLSRASRTAVNRRAVVALINGGDIRWWGGSIDTWRPDVSQLTSQASLDAYLKLVGDFKTGRKQIAHAVMVYKNGTFASVMLGVQNKVQVDDYLMEAMGIVQVRGAQGWMRV